MANKLYDIEVFKSGTHTDAAGNTNEWTDEDLNEIVKMYNEQDNKEKHTAPLVLGHPKDNAPAYGWVESLKKVGNKIIASVTDLSEDIKADVKAGKYKKVSISLYANKLLRHVGLLGAVPPAVKGLADVKFNDSNYSTYEFEDSVPTTEDPAEVELKNAQNERAKKYGITPKLYEVIRKEEQVLRKTFIKPEIYSNIPDDMFADPVNYRFPIDNKANFFSSLSLVKDWDTRNIYTKEELSQIHSRMYAAKEQLGIDSQEVQLFFFSEEISPRQKRAEKHKIKIVEGKGHDNIPGHYSELAEEEFADPVNLRFPIAKKYLLGSLASWSRDSVRGDYTEHEQQVIAARIINAAQENKINLTQYKWAYLDIDPNLLSRKQLLTVVGAKPNVPTSTNSPLLISPPPKKEFSMNEENINQLFADLLAWSSETLGEEVTTQLSAKITELRDKMKPAADQPPAGTEGSNHSENPELIALRKEVEVLKLSNRMNDHANFTESLIKQGKLLPAQRSNAIQILEAASVGSNIVSFSEGQATTRKAIADGVKAFLSSYPVIVNFNEEAPDKRGSNQKKEVDSEFAGADEERLELHAKVEAKAIEIAKQRGITNHYQCYSEALSIITTGA